MKEKLIYVIKKEQEWFAKRGKRSAEYDIVIDYLENGKVHKNHLNFPLLVNCMNNLEDVYFDFGIV